MIDVHTVPRPVLWFAVDHLGADGGVHVTGAGSPAAWTGLDFVGPRGRPIVDPETLATFDVPNSVPIGRPTRGGGGARAFNATVPYEAGLWRHFHALRPLHVVCGSASRMVRETLSLLFGRLPCRLSFVEIPLRQRDVLDPEDPDVARVADVVRRDRADLGLLIDEDGQRTAFVDERGEHVDPLTLASLVAGAIREDDPEAVVLPSSSDSADRIAATLDERSAAFAASADGRCWFGGDPPTADAILLLARVVTALSLNDTAFSVVLRGHVGRERPAAA